jgi:hypothetical protein
MRIFLLAGLLLLAGCVTGAPGIGPTRLEAETALVAANTCHDYDGFTTCTAEQVSDVRLGKLRCEPLPPDRDVKMRVSCSVAGSLMWPSGRSRVIRGRWEFHLITKDDGSSSWVAIPPLN